MRRIAIALLACACQLPAHAGEDPVPGLWLSADKAAVIEFKACPDAAQSMCGTIVWDKDAGTVDDACGVVIAKLKTRQDDTWRDGWVHDPRTKKNYKGTVRTRGGTLLVRAYIGTELLGETEVLTRVSSIPAGCRAKEAS